MQTINTQSYAETIIKKSKFISMALFVSSKKDVENKLNEFKKEFSDATHICYAYVVKENNQIFEKFSDDNEPNSTAGKPIMNVIKKNNLVNVLIVVIRYFGGIKLGSGGLIRAYSNSALLALKDVEFVELKNYVNIEIVLQYENINFIYELIKENKVILKNKNANIFNILVEKNNLNLLQLIKSKSESFQILGDDILNV